MKLLLKQKMFSWFDSYHIYNEEGAIVYEVKGKFAWGHCLKIYDPNGSELGTVKQEVLSMMPKFAVYHGEQCLGYIRREFAPFRVKYNIDYNGWHINGNFVEWDYTIADATGQTVAIIRKELLNWTDTYSIEVKDPENALDALMFVLAIDAEKCSRND